MYLVFRVASRILAKEAQNVLFILLYSPSIPLTRLRALQNMLGLVQAGVQSDQCLWLLGGESCAGRGGLCARPKAARAAQVPSAVSEAVLHVQ
jgi:hypothetical protein